MKTPDKRPLLPFESNHFYGLAAFGIVLLGLAGALFFFGLVSDGVFNQDDVLDRLRAGATIFGAIASAIGIPGVVAARAAKAKSDHDNRYNGMVGQAEIAKTISDAFEALTLSQRNRLELLDDRLTKTEARLEITEEKLDATKQDLEDTGDRLEASEHRLGDCEGLIIEFERLIQEIKGVMPDLAKIAALLEKAPKPAARKPRAKAKSDEE